MLCWRCSTTWGGPRDKSSRRSNSSSSRSGTRSPRKSATRWSKRRRRRIRSASADSHARRRDHRVQSVLRLSVDGLLAWTQVARENPCARHAGNGVSRPGLLADNAHLSVRASVGVFRCQLEIIRKSPSPSPRRPSVRRPRSPWPLPVAVLARRLGSVRCVWAQLGFGDTAPVGSPP